MKIKYLSLILASVFSTAALAQTTLGPRVYGSTNFSGCFTPSAPAPAPPSAPVAGPPATSPAPAPACPATTVSWTNGPTGSGVPGSCSGTVPAGNELSQATVSNTNPGNVGSAPFTCSGGSWSVGSSASCNSL